MWFQYRQLSVKTKSEEQLKAHSLTSYNLLWQNIKIFVLIDTVARQKLCLFFPHGLWKPVLRMFFSHGMCQVLRDCLHGKTRWTALLSFSFTCSVEDQLAKAVRKCSHLYNCSSKMYKNSQRTHVTKTEGGDSVETWEAFCGLICLGTNLQMFFIYLIFYMLSFICFSAWRAAVERFTSSLLKFLFDL